MGFPSGVFRQLATTVLLNNKKQLCDYTIKRLGNILLLGALFQDPPLCWMACIDSSKQLKLSCILQGQVLKNLEGKWLFTHKMYFWQCVQAVVFSIHQCFSSHLYPWIFFFFKQQLLVFYQICQKSQLNTPV